ncbi:protein mono-ADP-ribosyltransferase PARP14-like isoform X2 [Asterias amurensis]|uniref:protein mono-ADP-ribosyltransferase PARP14-like isoform X2 n=1 Tax=Asterias amurensis TaxID=7602 RepID=UPI003AB47659
MEANKPNQHLYEVVVRLPALVLPNEQKKLEMADRLHIYFQSKDGGDSDVECVRLLGGNGDVFWFKVWFVERSGVPKVLSRPDHEIVIDGIKIPLKLQGSPAPTPDTSESSSSENDFHKDTETRAKQKQDRHSDDKMKLGKTLTSASGDAQKWPQKNAASFVPQGATQHTSREKKMKVDLANQESLTRPGLYSQDTDEDLYGATGGTEVSHDVQSRPDLRTQHRTDSSKRRGSEDMYGTDEHHKVGRADTIKQDQQMKKHPGAAQRKNQDKTDSGIKKENLPDDPEEDEPEEDEQLIEVTGFKQSTDDEAIGLYFENGRKSGGGEIETIERDSKTGVIRITFKDQSVTSKVAGRTHKVSGVALNVKLITKKKHRPLPIEARCLFLDGIPDGCSSEHVKLFIENRASMDEEPTVRYGEKPGTAICTFSRDIPDLEDVIGKMSRRKLKGALLKAEKVHYSDAILVQGVPQDLEMVELYFDNKKKSGGSGVRELQPGPMDGQAIVYFEDWKVVQDVLRKGHHKLSGKDLQIESYHDFLGRLSPLDAPTPHIPKPVSIEVQELIMEFLFGKGANTKKKLLKDLTKVKANLLWPDGSQKSRAKLEPVEDDSQHQSSWLNWEKEAVDVLTDFMRGYKTARVPVPQTLWKGAADKLQKMTTACSMVPDTQLYGVILVGEQRDVDVTEATINDIIMKLQKEADYDAQQTTEEINWDADKLQLFTLCGIKQEIEKSFPALKITVFSSYGKTGITLDGIRKTIKDVELKIRRMMDTLEKTEVKAGSTKVRFVQRVPDKIHEVLGSKNIHAACSGSDDGKITIHGATTRDVREAKAYINIEIDEDEIAIKGQSALAVLQGHDGKRLLDSINNQKFVMAGISHEPGAKFIQLAGFKRNLDETKNHIMDFLKKNVIIKSTIPSNKSKIRLITTYHGPELEKVTQQHQQNLVAIQPQMSGRNRGFIIQGNEEGLEAIRQLVTSLVQAVKEKQYPVSKTGMARLFRQEKSKKFLESVEREFHCVITTDCNEESDDDEDEEGAGHASTATQILYSVTLPESRCRLRVCQGDLTMQRVDCIVNAANIKLEHIGGLAAAVLEAGGPVIQTESDDILKQKRRKLHVGEAVLTSSGNLPCKKVIHVAGPRWQAWGRTTPGGVTKEEQQLFDAVLNCLQLAAEEKFQSIAIPAISTGVYGFPVQLAAQQILNALGQFVWFTPNSSITDISLTNHDQPTCAVFMQAVAERFAGCLDDQAAGTDVDVTTAAAAGGPDRNIAIPVGLPNPAIETPRFTVSGLNVVTLEGLTIKMTKGSIAVEAVDVIVNTAGSDMNLTSGKVSQAISQAAGPTLQQECDTLIAIQGNVASWLFVETGPGLLTCKKIYHCVCEGYKQLQSEQLLKKLVLELMVNASRNGMTSMAIPALGTGNLSYPPAVTARCMYEAAFEFSSQHPNGSLKDVRFVVYDKDTTTIKGFEAEIQRLDPLSPGAIGGSTGGATGGAFVGATGNTNKKKKLKKKNSSSAGAVTDRESYSEIKRDSSGFLQSNIGSVCLQVQQGDLVRETTHAIVNSVGKGLNLHGPVSTAILKDGGELVKKQCDSLAKKHPHETVYTTGAGRLLCKSIFHVVTPETPEQMKAIVAKALQLAEKKGIPSLSFPALGTGRIGQTESCADIMLKAIGEFACRKKPQHLHLIRLVVFQPAMLPIFQKALENNVGQSYKQSKGFLQKGVDYLTKKVTSAVYGAEGVEDDKKEEELQETVILQLSAMDMNSLMKASDKLDTFQAEEFLSEDFPDPMGLLDKMTAEHKAELIRIGRKHDVTVEPSKGRAKFIRVEGCKFNVKDALLEISQMFTRIQKEENEKQKMEHLAKEVKWKYSTSSGMEDYDEEVNALLEDAYQKKKPTVTLDLEEGKAIIDFQQMQETSNGSIINVHRVDLKSAARFEPPSNWIPMMKGESTKMVKLTAGTQEYIAVETQFRASMSPFNNIIEIERIQSQDLMMQYQARRAALENRLNRTTSIEMILYHGTDEQTSKKISTQGFNRSFCGKNATVYGNGTYFAVSASYSAQAHYAKPDANGTKHIFVTNVLVGDFIRGSQGMITPPPKPQNPAELFDSVVDNMNAPGIYVIFHDAQAYPEYLIKFQ